MSKSDDMRKMREELYERRERDTVGRAAKAAPAPAPAPAAPPEAEHAAPAPAAEEPVQRSSLGRATPSASVEEQGKCAVCGKQRPLAGGLVAVHQKGFGKVCPGSRKAPA